MKKIPLTQGKVALVDDEDYEWLSRWKWYSLKRRSGIFYVTRNQWNFGTKKSSKICMHRLIMKAVGGEIVDHKDGNGLNNQRYNLRFCTGTQNNANSKLQKNSTSRYKGVTSVKYNRKWQSQIQHRYKHIHLGLYNTSEEAARVYDKKAIELFGEFARTNFPRRVARKKCQNIST